jgi:hypothetical protein
MTASARLLTRHKGSKAVHNAQIIHIHGGGEIRWIEILTPLNREINTGIENRQRDGAQRALNGFKLICGLIPVSDIQGVWMD